LPNPPLTTQNLVDERNGDITLTMPWQRVQVRVTVVNRRFHQLLGTGHSLSEYRHGYLPKELQSI